MEILRNAAPTLGLELKLSKCEIVPTVGQASTADLNAFPVAMKRKLDRNFKLLGAPIGDAEFCKDFLRAKRLHKTKDRLDALKDLGDAHSAYKILSTCLGSCKMMYAMRTTRSDWAQEVFAEFDVLLLLRETAESILGMPLHEFAWQQACLSNSGGGLGLRSAAAHAPAAFAASASATWHLCKAVDPHFFWDAWNERLTCSKTTWPLRTE